MDNYRFIDGFSLKLIASISMAIDHVGAVFYPEILMFRYIGRLAMPIFFFLMVEGFFHTRSIKKYLIRLFAFAVISQVPYSLSFYRTVINLRHLNVFFTLFLGLIVIYFLDKFFESGQYIVAFGVGILGALVSYALGLDGRYMAIGFAICFYLMHKTKDLSWNLALALIFIALNINPVQWAGALALIPIYFYNGKRGIGLKYVFYAFYPLHLGMIAFIMIYDKGFFTF